MVDKIGYEELYHSFFHRHLLRSERYYRFRAKYSVYHYLKYFDLNAGIMEFGVGLGQNIFFARHRAFGIDISDFCVKKCADRGIKVIKDIKQVKSNSLSGILCCHCLEHLDNPTGYLKEFFRVLKLNGKLVLLLPVEPNDMKPFIPSPTQHLFAWNLQTIGDLLQHVGFKFRFGKFNYATGFSKFYKLPFPLAVYLIKAVGMMSDTKELLVVVKKPHS